MKKLALTSLLAVFAISDANAANVIDGNPLYMPKAGHFYSVTSLGSHTEGTPYALGEEFGYGVMDNLAVNVYTSLVEDKAFDEYGWEDLAIKATFRAYDDGAWKADVYGEYAASGYLFAHSDLLKLHPAVKDDHAWFEKELLDYAWTLGVRGGYTTSQFTIAGHIEYGYGNTESFNWNEDKGFQGVHAMAFGLDGQFVIDPQWNLVAGVEYTGILDKELYGTPGAKIENAGIVEGYFGVNYNIDATKYVGAYINGTMNHWSGDDPVTPASEKGWGFEDGFGFGMKFGIDF
ncbi:MAG: hypothetical protein IKP05_02635 [Alphaproteobacteria bacterium]|nr:hypothetical protein [Alphaproteobacteria bacterium]